MLTLYRSKKGKGISRWPTDEAFAIAQAEHSMKTGKRNLISDVPGVRVGHTTISSEDIQTGVSVV
ncbi:MAG: P1 family peptidase, partial [Merdibacter sp.]